MKNFNTIFNNASKSLVQAIKSSIEDLKDEYPILSTLRVGTKKLPVQAKNTEFNELIVSLTGSQETENGIRKEQLFSLIMFARSYDEGQELTTIIEAVLNTIRGSEGIQYIDVNMSFIEVPVEDGQVENSFFLTGTAVFTATRFVTTIIDVPAVQASVMSDVNETVFAIQNIFANNLMPSDAEIETAIVKSGLNVVTFSRVFETFTVTGSNPQVPEYVFEVSSNIDFSAVNASIDADFAVIVSNLTVATTTDPGISTEDMEQYFSITGNNTVNVSRDFETFTVNVSNPGTIYFKEGTTAIDFSALNASIDADVAATIIEINSLLKLDANATQSMLDEASVKSHQATTMTITKTGDVVKVVGSNPNTVYSKTTQYTFLGDYSVYECTQQVTVDQYFYIDLYGNPTTDTQPKYLLMEIFTPAAPELSNVFRVDYTNTFRATTEVYPFIFPDNNIAGFEVSGYASMTKTIVKASLPPMQGYSGLLTVRLTLNNTYIAQNGPRSLQWVYFVNNQALVPFVDWVKVA